MSKRKKQYHRWRDVRAQDRTAAEIEKLEQQAKDTLLELDLRAVRELVGKTQAELAEQMGASQGELSRLERREDHRLSTLRRYVEGLGGRLEVTAHFGDKSVRLHGV